MPFTPAPVLMDEHERLRRVLRLGVGTGQRHDALDTLTALAASVLKCPIALVSIVEEERQFFLSRHGLDVKETGRAESLCGHCIRGTQPFAVPDAMGDARFVDNPLVVDAPHVRAYLGAPLFAAPGQSGVGSFCVIDRVARVWTDEDKHHLARLASLVEEYLANLSIRRAWDDAPLSMVVLDAEGRCLRVNPALARLVGRPPDDLLDRPLASCVMPADRSVLQAMVQHAVTRRESPTRRELRYVRLSGEVVNGGTSMAPLGDVSGQTICIIRDISLERRMTARSGVTAEVRRELDSPLMRARALSLALRDEGALTSAPSAQQALDSLESVLDEFSGLLDARIGDIGARVRAEAELDASEQRLRALLENVLGPLLVIDDRGRIVDCNAAATRNLGVAYETLVGTTLRTVMPLFTEQDCARWFELAAARSQSIDAPAETAMLIRADRTALHAEVRLMQMDWNGPGRLVVLIRDVTAAWTREVTLLKEREVLETRLRSGAEALSDMQQVESVLKASLEEKETLLKEIHHRVKNNLQMVSSLLSLQMDQMPEGRPRALLGESVQRVRSMALIHQHLYGSVSLERIDVGTYARSLADTLRMSLAPGALVKVDAVAAELTVERAVPMGLILNELLTNAFKHGDASLDTPSGGAHAPAGAAAVGPAPGPPWTVLVELREDQRRLRLTVRDRGPGLPEGFSMAGHPSLGLQLIGTLVRQLRGRARAWSDGGAVFEVEFPLDARGTT